MQETFTALSGALAVERRMGQVANNLANINTAGFRANHTVSEAVEARPDYDTMRQSVDEKYGVTAPTRSFFHTIHCSLREDSIDFSTGVPRESGLPTDMMIEGPGFFALRAPLGIRYTRQGSFVINSEGLLTSVDGYPVVARDGSDIRVEDDEFTVGTDGTIMDRDGNTIDNILIVDFEDKSQIAKEANTLFRPRNINIKPVTIDEDKTQLRQGWLEGSNVEVINELVDMIALHRAYESFQKLIQASDELDGHMISTVTPTG